MVEIVVLELFIENNLLKVIYQESSIKNRL